MDATLTLLKGVNRLLTVAATALATAITALMVTALTASALTRYISGTGYDWLIELPPALVPWLVFPLLGPLLRQGQHIQVDILPTLLRGKRLLYLQFAVYLIALTGAVIFTLAGIEAVTLFRNLGQLMELEVEIPIWWMYLAFPVGFFILGLFALEAALDTLGRIRGQA